MVDYFVTGVSIALGCCGLFAAVTNADWPLRWSLAAWLHRRAGLIAMRVGYAAGGLGMIAMGIAIALQ